LNLLTPPLFFSPCIFILSLVQVSERLAAACGGCRARADGCQGEEDCSRAYMALTYCTAQIVCEPAVRALRKKEKEMHFFLLSLFEKQRFHSFSIDSSSSSSFW